MIIGDQWLYLRYILKDLFSSHMFMCNLSVLLLRTLYALRKRGKTAEPLFSIIKIKKNYSITDSF